MKVSKQSRWADSPGGLLASLVPTSGNFYQFGDDAAARMSGEGSGISPGCLPPAWAEAAS